MLFSWSCSWLRWDQCAHYWVSYWAAMACYWLCWQTLAHIVYERGTNAAFVTGQAVQAVLCDTVNRWGCAGPSVFSAGSLMSIAVDCSSKGRAICQRCHKKGGSMLERSRVFSVSLSHTHTPTRTYSWLSHFAVAAETNWTPIGWSVPLKCD